MLINFKSKTLNFVWSYSRPVGINGYTRLIDMEYQRVAVQIISDRSLCFTNRISSPFEVSENCDSICCRCDIGKFCSGRGSSVKSKNRTSKSRITLGLRSLSVIVNF